MNAFESDPQRRSTLAQADHATEEDGVKWDILWFPTEGVARSKGRETCPQLSIFLRIPPDVVDEFRSNWKVRVQQLSFSVANPYSKKEFKKLTTVKQSSIKLALLAAEKKLTLEDKDWECFSASVTDRGYLSFLSYTQAKLLVDSTGKLVIRVEIVRNPAFPAAHIARIVQHFKDEFETKNPGTKLDSEALERLRSECWSAKRALTSFTQVSTDISMDSLMDGINFKATLNRSTFEELKKISKEGNADANTKRSSKKVSKLATKDIDLFRNMLDRLKNASDTSRTHVSGGEEKQNDVITNTTNTGLSILKDKDHVWLLHRLNCVRGNQLEMFAKEDRERSELAEKLWTFVKDSTTLKFSNASRWVELGENFDSFYVAKEKDGSTPKKRMAMCGMFTNQALEDDLKGTGGFFVGTKSRLTSATNLMKLTFKNVQKCAHLQNMRKGGGSSGEKNRKQEKDMVEMLSIVDIHSGEGVGSPLIVGLVWSPTTQYLVISRNNIHIICHSNDRTGVNSNDRTETKVSPDILPPKKTTTIKKNKKMKWIGLKRAYKALKKNPNSTPEEIAAAEAAYKDAQAENNKNDQNADTCTQGEMKTVESSTSSSSSTGVGSNDRTGTPRNTSTKQASCSGQQHGLVHKRMREIRSTERLEERMSAMLLTSKGETKDSMYPERVINYKCNFCAKSVPGEYHSGCDFESSNRYEVLEHEMTCVWNLFRDGDRVRSTIDFQTIKKGDIGTISRRNWKSENESDQANASLRKHRVHVYFDGKPYRFLMSQIKHTGVCDVVWFHSEALYGTFGSHLQSISGKLCDDASKKYQFSYYGNLLGFRYMASGTGNKYSLKKISDAKIDFPEEKDRNQLMNFQTKGYQASGSEVTILSREFPAHLIGYRKTVKEACQLGNILVEQCKSKYMQMKLESQVADSVFSVFKAVQHWSKSFDIGGTLTTPNKKSWFNKREVVEKNYILLNAQEEEDLLDLFASGTFPCAMKSWFVTEEMELHSLHSLLRNALIRGNKPEAALRTMMSKQWQKFLKRVLTPTSKERTLSSQQMLVARHVMDIIMECTLAIKVRSMSVEKHINATFEESVADGWTLSIVSVLDWYVLLIESSQKFCKKDQKKLTHMAKAYVRVVLKRVRPKFLVQENFVAHAISLQLDEEIVMQCIESCRSSGKNHNAAAGGETKGEVKIQEQEQEQEKEQEQDDDKDENIGLSADCGWHPIMAQLLNPTWPRSDASWIDDVVYRCSNCSPSVTFDGGGSQFIFLCVVFSKELLLLLDLERVRESPECLEIIVQAMLSLPFDATQAATHASKQLDRSEAELGATLLTFALLTSKSPLLVALLVTAGADINTLDLKTGYNACHQLAMMDEEQDLLVQFLAAIVHSKKAPDLEKRCGPQVSHRFASLSLASGGGGTPRLCDLLPGCALGKTCNGGGRRKPKLPSTWSTTVDAITENTRARKKREKKLRRRHNQKLEEEEEEKERAAVSSVATSDWQKKKGGKGQKSGKGKGRGSTEKQDKKTPEEEEKEEKEKEEEEREKKDSKQDESLWNETKLFEKIEAKWSQIQLLDLNKEEERRKEIGKERKKREEEKKRALAALEEDTDDEEDDHRRDPKFRADDAAVTAAAREDSDDDDDDDEGGESVELEMWRFDSQQFPCAVQPTFRSWLERTVKRDRALCEKVMAYVGRLVSGQFKVGDQGTTSLAKSLKSSNTPHGLKLFETKFKFQNKAWRILWDRTPMFSRRQTNIGSENVDFIFCEHIRLWYVVSKRGGKQSHAIREIHLSYSRGLESRICKRLKPVVRNEERGGGGEKKKEFDSTFESAGQYQYPQTYSLKLDFDQAKMIEDEYDKSKVILIGGNLVKEGEAGGDGGGEVSEIKASDHKQESSVENVTLSAPVGSAKRNHYGIHPSVELNRAAVFAMLHHTGRFELPKMLQPDQENICYYRSKKSMLVLGRSGTGKTTVMVYRMWYEYLHHWLSVRNKTAPVISVEVSVVSGGGAAGGSTDPKTIEVPIHKHQLFLTRSGGLRSEVCKQFWRIRETRRCADDDHNSDNVVLPLFPNYKHGLASGEADVGEEKNGGLNHRDEDDDITQSYSTIPESLRMHPVDGHPPIHEGQWPLFLAGLEWFYLLDGSLPGKPFKHFQRAQQLRQREEKEERQRKKRESRTTLSDDEDEENDDSDEDDDNDDANNDFDLALAIWGEEEELDTSTFFDDYSFFF